MRDFDCDSEVVCSCHYAETAYAAYPDDELQTARYAHHHPFMRALEPSWRRSEEITKEIVLPEYAVAR